jgi:hypothetical protein
LGLASSIVAEALAMGSERLDRLQGRSKVMKLVFLPTLTDIQDMLGENLYVDLIWMSRERDHTMLKQERFATWASKFSAWNAGGTPEPVFMRPESLEIDVVDATEPDLPPLELPQEAQVQSVHALNSLLDMARSPTTTSDYPVRAAAGGGKR